MIDTNELRVGNIILALGGKATTYSGSTESMTVDGKAVTEEDYRPIRIGINDFIAIEKLPWLYNPIPLTTEIMEKCGFTKNYVVWRDSSTLFEIDHDYEPTTNNGECSIGEKIQYLHQLQNLYFALTGQELKIML